MPRISKSRQNEIRQSIVDEARALFFSKGFDKTSTKEISKKVGIAEGTLFNYFSNKNDLFVAAIASEFDIEQDDTSFSHRAEDTAPEVIYQFLSKMYEPFLRLPKFMIPELSIVLINIGKNNSTPIKNLLEIDLKYMRECKKLIDALKERGLFIAETDTQELSENILSTFLFEVILYAYEAEMTRDEMMRRFKKKIESVCKGYLTVV